VSRVVEVAGTLLKLGVFTFLLTVVISGAGRLLGPGKSITVSPKSTSVNEASNKRLRANTGSSQNLSGDVNSSSDESTRPDITMIFDAESPREQALNRAARRYFRNRDDSNSVIIENVETFRRAVQYLKRLGESREKPWGKINFVVHGNPWTGMGIPVVDGGARTTSASLKRARRSEALPRLSNHVMDQQTRIRLYGCALGKNRKLLTELQRVLGGTDSARPAVLSSRYFELFEWGNRGYFSRSVTRTQARPYYAFYRKSRSLSIRQIVNRLQRRYPAQTINWRNAFRDGTERQGYDLFSERFSLPIRWTVTYPDVKSRPELEGLSDKLTWLHERDRLKSFLASNNIPFDRFDWDVERVTTTDNSGESKPGLRVVGWTMVVTVLKPLEAGGELPRTAHLESIKSVSSVTTVNASASPE
jgi:hypothetical protein